MTPENRSARRGEDGEELHISLPQMMDDAGRKVAVLARALLGGDVFGRRVHLLADSGGQRRGWPRRGQAPAQWTSVSSGRSPQTWSSMRAADEGQGREHPPDIRAVSAHDALHGDGVAAFTPQRLVGD